MNRQEPALSAFTPLQGRDRTGEVRTVADYRVPNVLAAIAV